MSEPTTPPQDPTQELHKDVTDLVLRILARGRTNQLEIEGKLLVSDMGINVRKDGFIMEVERLITHHTATTIQQVLADVDRLVIGHDKPGITNVMVAKEHERQLMALRRIKRRLGVKCEQ